MNMIALFTKSITDVVLCKDKVIVKQKTGSGYVKNWFCEAITVEQYQELIEEINTKTIITLKLKEGK